MSGELLKALWAIEDHQLSTGVNSHSDGSVDFSARCSCGWFRELSHSFHALDEMARAFRAQHRDHIAEALLMVDFA